MGAVAVVEPQDYVMQALSRYNLQSPVGLIRMMIQQSNCFIVVERGMGMQNMMQERALAGRPYAERLNWVLADLATVDLGRGFDAIVMAGNVMIFLAPGSEGQVVANLARGRGRIVQLRLDHPHRGVGLERQAADILAQDRLEGNADLRPAQAAGRQPVQRAPLCRPKNRRAQPRPLRIRRSRSSAVRRR